MKEKIWLSPPHMSGYEKNYIDLAFKENWIAPVGPNVEGFENDLEKYLKEKVYVSTHSSGTASIHLALNLIGVSQGDEVLVQSFTFVGSVNPVIYLGAKPIFIDSEKETWNLCPEILENAINDRIKLGKKPKAIIAVHLYGNPYKVYEINNISKKYEIPIIEDSAEALGSSYNGQLCGTFGDFGILSFNGNKIITTSGGGALISKSKKIKNEAIFLSTQARDPAEHYQHSKVGYNYRLSNISAGIGRGQLKVINERIYQRSKIKNEYKSFFEKVSGVQVFSSNLKNIISNNWLTTIILNKKFKKQDIINKLNNENIECRSLWKPMHLQPIYSNCIKYESGISEALFDRGICLPSGSNLSKSQKERIFNVLKTIFKT